MLTPLPMQRVTIQLLSEDAPRAALVLAQAGLFAPEPLAAHAGELPELPGERQREAYRSARSRLEKVLAHCGLREADVPPPRLRDVPLAELEQWNAWLGEVWAECSRAQEALRAIEEERKHVEQLLRTLDNFAALDIDLGLLAGAMRFLDVHVGTVPSGNVARLREALALAGYVLTPFLAAGEVQHVVVAGPSGREDEVRAVLQAAGWRPTSIPPELRDRPDKVRRELEERLARAREEHAARRRAMEETARGFRGRLIQAAQALALAAPHAELGEALRGRGGLAAIGGWVARRDVPRLRAALDAKFARPYVLSARDPLPGERAQVPSAMRHPWFARPFALLVRNYGVPRYGEIDPTLLFAASFVVMFGMMFGDVGQGAVIALAGLAFARKLRVFSAFFLAAGVSSMVFGLLYGSVFGYEELIHAAWMSPMSDPMRMLTLALYWGIGFILVATALTVYNRLREGHYGEALFDGRGLAGMAFYLGVIYAAYRGFAQGAFGAIEVAAAALPLLVILGYKWHEYAAPFGERLLVVLIEGFETVLGYFANTLSFLRVAAFSLNHVALAIAVFTLAGMMGTAGHWVTVVLGNLFILVLEGAIVAIQVLRLEYYEGFSRFYRGDGREFRPLTLAWGRRHGDTPAAGSEATAGAA